MRSEIRSADGLRTVVIAAALYSLAHVALRLAVSDNLGEDDGRTNILLQELRLVWWAKQPPLYDWLLAGVQSVLGPTLASFLVLKYLLLVAIAVMVFLIARRVLGDPWWALLTVEALGLVYQLSWRFHEGFTNAVGAMACTLALLLALISVADRKCLANFVWLGVAAGAALLTSISGFIVVAGFAVAALFVPQLRRRIFTPRLWLSLAIALAIAAPYMLWLAANTARLAELVLPTPDEIELSFAARAWLSLIDAVRGPVFALSPLLPILPLAFPGLLERLRAAVNGNRPPTEVEPLERLIGIYSLLVWAVLLVILPLAGQPGFATHTQLPFFLPTVIWLLAKAKKACRNETEARRFSQIAIGLAGFAFLLRAANLIVLDPVCGTCRWAHPYDELAGAMRDAGFTQGTILTLDNDIGGNLRRFFRQARVRSNATGWFTPHDTAASKAGPTVYVWSARFPPEFAARIGRAYLGPAIVPLLSAPHVVKAEWRYPYPRTVRQHSEWRFVILR